LNRQGKEEFFCQFTEFCTLSRIGKENFTYMRFKPHMPPQWRCVSQTLLLFSPGHSSIPRSRTLAYSHTATHGPCLPTQWSLAP